MTQHRVTRKGQVTIPVDIRRKFDFAEGSEVEFQVTGDCVQIRRVPSVFDLAGSGAKQATPTEMNALLEKLRAQDA